MNDRRAWWQIGLRRLALAGAVLVPCAPAAAAELTLFVSGAGPSPAWQRGYGGAFTITFLDLVHGEIEGLKQGSDVPDSSLLTGAAKAYVGPTIGRLVPYAGLGVGVYHWGRLDDDLNSGYSLLFVGLKLRLPVGVVLRGEYQRVAFEDDPVLQFDDRVLLGAGLRF